METKIYITRLQQEKPAGESPAKTRKDPSFSSDDDVTAATEISDGDSSVGPPQVAPVTSNHDSFKRRVSLDNTTNHCTMNRRRASRRNHAKEEVRRRGSFTGNNSKSKVEMDDEELCAALAGETCEIEETINGMTADNKADSKTTSRRKKEIDTNHDKADNMPDSEAERLQRANQVMQMKHLEQRRKERAIRLEAAKERIRQQQESGAAAVGSKAKDKTAKRGHGDDAGEKKTLSDKERRDLAYQWYVRCGMPAKENFRQRIRRMQGACDVTPDDVDLLPWIHGGARVNVREVLMGV